MKHLLWNAVFVAALAPAAWSQDSTVVKDTAVVTDSAPVHIRSAFVDYSERHSLTLFGGYFGGNVGSAGVGPQSSAIVGLAYRKHLSGPVNAFARFSYAPSKRTVLDPYQPKADQVVGTTSQTLYMLDLALTLDITGEKLWHGMSPYVGLALGAANGGSTPDVGGYKFGTQFYVGLGAGLKYHIKGPWVISASAWDYFWQLQYPTTYFVSGPNSVLPINSPDKDWTGNWALTFGISYLLKR